jgi:hypothetical protein
LTWLWILCSRYSGTWDTGHLEGVVRAFAC